MTPMISAKAKSLSVWPPRIRRQMIAVVRSVAILGPNRPGDVFPPASRGAELVLEVLLQVVLVGSVERLRADLPVLEVAVDGLALALDDGVGLALLRHERLNLPLRVRLARLELELRPALEVDPEIEALGAERDQAGDDHGARDREPQLLLAHVVDLQPLRRLLALRAHEARAVEPLEAAEQAEHRARGDHRREQRDHGAD